VLAVNYEDKFGPLGTISVIHGNIAGIVLHIHTWVLSCRAFTRRIEYQCLKTLFELSGAAAMEFDFRCTAKNGPVQDFFAGLLKDRPVNSSTLRLTRAQFEEKCPMLYQEVRVIRGAEVNG
jgi:predicted enzyme involved in methoxymalonyl-ACP biosynthesis